VSSSPPGHMTELVRRSLPPPPPSSPPPPHTPLSHPIPPFTSLPASPLLLSAEHRPTTARCRLSASRATRTLRPPACTLLLLSHSHSHALPLAAPPVATLGSRALLQIHPPFRQTCLLASIATHCSHHSFGFELCEFPRHHHPIPVSRDFTFTSGYLCFTLRRFTSQRPHLHARH